MNSIKIIAELCKINTAQTAIITAQANIITAQADAIEQLGAVCMEEERAEVKRQIAALADRYKATNP